MNLADGVDEEAAEAVIAGTSNRTVNAASQNLR
ncbi:hypothetical protein HPL003_27055 [Paenibacillus terrae HPL-003]|uniref:Uncharacterized protein n=1 Tax=Paenibacillus terrae (strain HPL-003) TaxID=985665 RepID=G7VSB4_PAETH|nr:hypothetical protein HPL003_27055 [Paenibacillus terrae HPL-003]